MSSGVENSDVPVEDVADTLKVKAISQCQIDRYGQTKSYHRVIVTSSSYHVHIWSLFLTNIIASKAFGHFSSGLKAVLLVF